MQVAKFWVFFLFVLLTIHVFRSVPLFIDTYVQHYATQKNELWRKVQCNDMTFYNNMKSLNSDFCDHIKWQTDIIIQQSPFWLSLQACMPFKDETMFMWNSSSTLQAMSLPKGFAVLLLLTFMLLFLCIHYPQFVYNGCTAFHAQCKSLMQNLRCCCTTLFDPNFQRNRSGNRLHRMNGHEEANLSYYNDSHLGSQYDSRPIRFRTMYRPPPSPLRKRIEN